jgi:transcriptional regulator with XRE-family HTH domain
MTPVRLRLADLRALKGWTQEKLATVAGISRITVIRIESGESRRIDLDILEKLANALDCDAAMLIEHDRSGRAGKGRK